MLAHIMNRGDRRELIVMDDADRQRFVDTLGEACAKAAPGHPGRNQGIVRAPNPRVRNQVFSSWPQAYMARFRAKNIP